MAFKTNYHHQRAERDRAKLLKKEVKLQQKKEMKANQKAGLDTADEPPPAADDAPPSE